MRHISLVLLFLAVTVGFAEAGSVHTVQYEGPVTPLTVEVFEDGIAKATADDAELVVFLLDTPGGLVTSTRKIVQAIMTSDVPVAIYVSPNGAHAASAGAYMTYAAHIAAMAPATNIGSAHPVIGDGGFAERFWKDYEEYKRGNDAPYLPTDDGQPQEEDAPEDASDASPDPENQEGAESVMAQKVRQDMLAWVRSIAEARDRNVAFAEATVKEALSVSASEALEEGIIDIVADSFDNLLEQAHGRTVDVNGEERTLSLKDVRLVEHETTFRQKVLGILADPNVLYILLLLGVTGISLEIYNPGAIFPGVIGGLSIILSLWAQQVLPVNYAGLLLLIAGMVLFIMEAKIVSYGLLSVGGIAAFSIGGIMLFDGPIPELRVAYSVLITVSTLIGLTVVGVLYLIVRSHEAPVTTGQSGMIGRSALVEKAFVDGRGTVVVNGEIWRAVGTGDFEAGQVVEVRDVEGLTLTVGTKSNT